MTNKIELVIEIEMWYLVKELSQRYSDRKYHYNRGYHQYSYQKNGRDSDGTFQKQKEKINA